ncbi:conserved hypothetical protein [Candida dubliniensis CD36]|uniref:SH3 domain-containing protein n=1 Tax=Candida dubliniensis (strain CD36 / ATCC MYA-646 / CBS 7987 / NCPF 3949 / NRRL Y-17841) TaxID=573826 RepID=B9W8D8_CANDC|nr:conserved hypothetical protein [Candida dubliniensis CD36]CAX45008.1 conserved hypothetical protein [Candida dubliniensis CD36]
MKVKAIFDYKSDYDEDLNFDAGTIINIISVENDEWYSGEYDGKQGMFPKNFVEVLDEPTANPDQPIIPEESKSAQPLKVETTNDDVVSNEAPVETNSPKKSIEKPVGSPTETVHSASKAIESHASKVPMPQSFPSKPVDPYSIKKQFVGASASSYVPKIQPRDDSYLIARPLHDSKAPLVTSHDDPVEKPEEEIPKLSLKERIALIQKQQQEEAEREAEAIRRKEERNKRKAEEREKLKHLKETQQDVNVPSEISAHGTGESIHIPTSPTRNNEPPKVHDTVKETEGPIPSAVEANGEDAEGDYKKDEPNYGERNVQAGDEEEEGEEEEEEEETEEDKRRRLIERMAKISGGRNMFGMMGMPTPFGAPPQRAPSKKKREASKEPSSDTVTSPPRDSAPPASEPPTSPISKSVSSHKISVPPSAIPARVSDLASSEFSHESSSIAEDDEESDIDRHQVSSNALENEIGTDKTINLSKGITAEIEGAGYDADLSEAAKNEERKEYEIPQAPPVSVAPVPAPPPPSLPPHHTSDETEVQEVDSEQEGQLPPVPSRAPPIPVPAPTSAPVPAPAEAPPIPDSNVPVPFQSKHVEEDEEDEESSSDGDFEFAGAPPHHQLPQRAQSGSRPAATVPPIPSTAVPNSRPPPPPPIPVGEPPKRAATDFPSLAGSNDEEHVSTTRKSLDSTISRSKSLRRHSTVASQFSSNFAMNGWWLEDELPDELASQLGSDVIYEVDSNVLTKRGGKTVEYKDYYILWYDLSQLVIEIAYDVNDAENSARLINQYVKPTPPLATGQTFPILDQATQLLGDRLDHDFVRYLFELNSDILPIIGNKSFGVTVYKVVRTPSVNNSTKLGEVLPGDILYIRGGSFSHKGLIGHKSTNLGEGEPYTAVIYEFDPVKEKFKLIEQDQSGHIIKGSYKISDMSSGRLRVFRPVGRQFVGW